MKRIYLDYAATTPTRKEVLDAMSPYFTDMFGNPSAVHSYGQEARQAVDEGRKKVASLLGAKVEEIVFTSGGTEADNLAIMGVAYANENKGNHIITSAIEHHAVLVTCKFLESKGWKVTYLPVDSSGLVNPDDVKRAITSKTVLVSIMHANNEIGTIEPIAEISKITRENKIYMHTDAVQTAGRIVIDVNELGVDLLAVSAHKFYGPKGIGTLYIREGTKINPISYGGGQEDGRRSSTENVPGIVGFGKAAEMVQKEMPVEITRLTVLRNKLIAGIVEHIDRVELNGHPQLRLPNNVNVCIDKIEGESVVLSLDLEGICSSSGSACHSASIEPSHVLLAIGRPHIQAHGSLRLTMGRWTTEDDINRVLDVLPRTISKLRAISPL
jgi:cysteine desulfurase